METSTKRWTGFIDIKREMLGAYNMMRDWMGTVSTECMLGNGWCVIKFRVLLNLLKGQ